jgi:RimJ/RimL family protein N-acetyltransferase
MVLETKRLTLREMTFNDVNDLLEVFCDPEAMQLVESPHCLQLTPKLTIFVNTNLIAT